MEKASNFGIPLNFMEKMTLDLLANDYNEMIDSGKFGEDEDGGV